MLFQLRELIPTWRMPMATILHSGFVIGVIIKWPGNNVRCGWTNLLITARAPVILSGGSASDPLHDPLFATNLKSLTHPQARTGTDLWSVIFATTIAAGHGLILPY
jgi:hypothetical protein